MCSVNVDPPWISKSRLGEASKIQLGIELAGFLLGEASELWVRTPVGVIFLAVRQKPMMKKKISNEPYTQFWVETIYLYYLYNPSACFDATDGERSGAKSRLDEASKTKPEIELTVDLLGEARELWVCSIV